MQYFCEGFVMGLFALVPLLLVRYLKDAFTVGIRPENDFKE